MELQPVEGDAGAGAPSGDAQSLPDDAKVWEIRGPTIDAYMGKIAMAYVRRDDDTHSVQTRFSSDGVYWAPPARLGPAAHDLAVSAFDGQLVIAYASWPSCNESRLYTIWSVDGVNWSAPRPVGMSRTPTFGVALTGFDGRLYLAYVDAKTHDVCVVSTLDGHDWSPGGRLDGHKAYSGSALALAPFHGSLILAYVNGGPGSGPRRLLTAASADGVDWTPTPEAGIVDEGQCSAPALAAFEGRLAACYRRDANLVLRLTDDGTEWTSSIGVTGDIGDGTAVTAFKDELVAAYIKGDTVATASSADGLHWEEHGNVDTQGLQRRTPTIIRAHVMHTPRNPFGSGEDPFGSGEDALDSYPDGAVAFAKGAIVAMGSYEDVNAAYPDAEVLDERDCVLLPGLVDTHIHYPQLTIIGPMGRELLPWLIGVALPEEARYDSHELAEPAAKAFVDSLAANGTTTALVFGSHFLAAQHALFDAADHAGLRVTSGLVVSDRVDERVDYPHKLRTTAERALAEGKELVDAWHNQRRLRYAVTPRFAPFCTDDLFDSCRELMDYGGDVFLTSHLNESLAEILLVDELFQGEKNYLDTYERHGLIGRRSVLAHNVHPKDEELKTLAMRGATIAHCPSSNALLGSGVFPMRKHLHRRVRFALGTDVGAGGSPSMFSEGMNAYQMQMVLRGYQRPPDKDGNRPPVERPGDPDVKHGYSPDCNGYLLSSAHMLYLATKAGAEALDLGDEVGDLTPGKRADMVLVRPPEGGTLYQSFERFKHRPGEWGKRAESEGPKKVTPESALLGAIFALAREDCVARVYVDGDVVSTRP